MIGFIKIVNQKCPNISPKEFTKFYGKTVIGLLLFFMTNFTSSSVTNPSQSFLFFSFSLIMFLHCKNLFNCLV